MSVQTTLVLREKANLLADVERLSVGIDAAQRMLEESTKTRAAELELLAQRHANEVNGWQTVVAGMCKTFNNCGLPYHERESDTFEDTLLQLSDTVVQAEKLLQEHHKCHSNLDRLFANLSRHAAKWEVPVSGPCSWTNVFTVMEALLAVDVHRETSHTPLDLRMRQSLPVDVEEQYQSGRLRAAEEELDKCLARLDAMSDNDAELRVLVHDVTVTCVMLQTALKYECEMRQDSSQLENSVNALRNNYETTRVAYEELMLKSENRAVAIYTLETALSLEREIAAANAVLLQEKEAELQRLYAKEESLLRSTAAAEQLLARELLLREHAEAELADLRSAFLETEANRRIMEEDNKGAIGLVQGSLEEALQLLSTEQEQRQVLVEERRKHEEEIRESAEKIRQAERAFLDLSIEVRSLQHDNDAEASIARLQQDLDVFRTSFAVEEERVRMLTEKEAHMLVLLDGVVAERDALASALLKLNRQMEDQRAEWYTAFNQATSKRIELETKIVSLSNHSSSTGATVA